MRVLLIEPGYNWPFPDKPWAPWGKMQLASYLRMHGDYDVKIMDNAFFNGTDDGIRHTVGTEVQPDIIGIGGMTLQRNDALRIARVICEMYPDKTKRPLMVVGGVHFTFCPEDAYQYFDVVVMGEGEQTLLEVCQRYESTGKKWGATAFQDIKGVSYFGYGEWLVNEPRPLLDLAEFPLPAFELLPWFKDYNDGFFNGEKHPMLMTGRGCPYNCEFCASPQIYQRKTRVYPVEWVVACMQQLRRVHPGKGFRVMDDTFALSHKRVLEVCSGITNAFGKTRMTCLTHCGTVNREAVQLMAESGFWVTALGIESGNNEILKRANKGITVEQAAESIQVIRSAGMFVEGLFMLGNIGETEQTCLDTIEFAKKHNHPSQYPFHANWNWFQFATPFPGSRFFQDARNHGTVTTMNYDEYHHQKPVFIPSGMTESQLLQLRDRAFREAS